MLSSRERESSIFFDAIASVSLSTDLPIPNCFTQDFDEPPLRGIPGLREGAFGELVIIPALALAEVNACIVQTEFVGKGSIARLERGGKVAFGLQEYLARKGGLFDRLDKEAEKASEVSSNVSVGNPPAGETVFEKTTLAADQ